MMEREEDEGNPQGFITLISKTALVALRTPVRDRILGQDNPMGYKGKKQKLNL